MLPRTLKVPFEAEKSICKLHWFLFTKSTAGWLCNNRRDLVLTVLFRSLCLSSDVYYQICLEKDTQLLPCLSLDKGFSKVKLN